ncbi:porin-like protein [Fluviicoccus keumensis]|uniref:Porin-like protein n=1 Tax=Fluviicoccus keumensis TaxID=1435465 RepID=A0A4Q7ZA99_9GAMM|nr:porin [Fluviicoccus keumensis]RZU47001.1 porin-like protein [Fluviicoccus keumensis]
MKFILKHLALLPLMLSTAAFAADGAEWHFDLGGSLTREHYPSGSLTTAEALLNPSVSVGDLQLYAEAPYYGKEVNFSGTLNIYGPLGRLLGTRTVSKSERFEGIGDIVVGGDYRLPIADDNVLALAGMNYKFDNGDEKQLLGSGSRDLSLTLDGRYRWQKVDFKAGVGHTWIDYTTSNAPSDDYTYWSAGLAVQVNDPLRLSVTWSDQQSIAGVKTNQSAVNFGADLELSNMLSVNAGYSRYEKSAQKGQPESAATIGVNWSL